MDEKDVIIENGPGSIAEEEINTDSQQETGGRFEKDLRKLKRAEQVREEVQCYAELVAALKKVNDLTKVHCTKKNSTYPPLTKKSCDELKAAYQEAGVLCTMFLSNELAGNKSLSSMTNIVSQIESNLRSDLTALDMYDRMKVPVTMPLLLDYSRTDIIDLGDNDLGKVGANLSSRIPFGYVNPDGSETKGVFTRKNYFNSGTIYQNKINELSNKYPEMKEYFDVLLDGYGKLLEKTNKKPLRNDLVYGFCREFAGISESYDTQPRRKRQQFEKAIKNCLELAGRIDLAKKYENALHTSDAEGKFPAEDASLAFGKAMTDLARVELGVNLAGAGIANNSRIDSRNTGMSIVADMMGVSNVIARSKPMKIRYKNEVIEGTFMELGKGREFGDPTQAGTTYGPDKFENRNMGSVSDLLVLDFICGNIDRHASNILYQFGNENDNDWSKHVWLGPQGIDNDACLGEFVPKNAFENNNRMASINDIHAIKYSTAQAVLAMKPEHLKFRLRGLELSDKQIEAACQRLQLIQKSIVTDDMTPKTQKRLKEHKNKGTFQMLPGRLRVIPDEKFGLLDLEDQLVPQGGKTNAYLFLKLYGEEAKITLENPELRRKPLVPRTVNELFGYIIRPEEPAAFDKMLETLAGVTDKNSKGEFKRTSKQFESLRTSIKNYAAFCRDHEEQLLTPADYDIRNAYLKQITERAQAYLDFKGPGKHREYTQKRVVAVTGLLQQVKNRYDMTDLNLYRDMMKKPQEQLTPAEKTYRLEMNKYDERNVQLLNAKLREEANRIAEEAAKKQTSAPSKAL